MVSGQERPEKEDTGLCSQLPRVHRSRGARPLLRQPSAELWVEPPTLAQMRRWAQKSRLLRSQRPGAEASRMDLFSPLVRAGRVLSPAGGSRRSRSTLSVPCRAQHTSRMQSPSDHPVRPDSRAPSSRSPVPPGPGPSSSGGIGAMQLWVQAGHRWPPPRSSGVEWGSGCEVGPHLHRARVNEQLSSMKADPWVHLSLGDGFISQRLLAC